eukprot:scaffold2155_cov162-Amphora_coffeaeformis.AAC.9
MFEVDRPHRVLTYFESFGLAEIKCHDCYLWCKSSPEKYSACIPPVAGAIAIAKERRLPLRILLQIWY